jgi:hypothetical protein
MADHSSFLKTARRLVSKHGRSVSFYKLSNTIANPAKPWEGAGVPTETGLVTTNAVFLPHAGELELGKVIHDMEVFRKAEQMIMVAPPTSGVNLEEYHLMVDGSVRWRIEVIRTIKPANLAVLYVAGVCR